MKFSSVKFKNFLSYGDEVQEINLAKKGIHLITGVNKKDGGSNGSGKSTAIVDSLCYSIFGKTTKKIKADQIVNRSIGKDCFVETNFKINNDDYKIIRYRLHSEYGNSLFFYKNGEDISGESKSDTQSKIESTLKLSFKAFVSGIVLSQEKVSNFAESDPLDRRKIIENLLMYDFISRYHTATKEILRTINPEIERLNNQIEDKKDTVETIKNNLYNYVEQKEKEEENRKEKIRELKEELDTLNKINIENELSIVNDIRKTNENIANNEEKTKKAIEEKKEKEKSVKNYEKSIKNINEEIINAKDNPETCPLCGNVIDQNLVDKYLNDKNNELENIERDKDDAKSKLNELNDRIKELKNKVDSDYEKLDELNKNRKSDLGESDLNDSKSKVNQINSEIKYLEQNPIDIDNDKIVNDSTKEINRHKKELKKSRKKLNGLENDKSYYEWWKTALSNTPNSMKTFTINHVIKSFNKYINYYLSFFGYDISYQLNEELEETIYKDGYESNFGSFSGGEKRSLEISLVFALYELIRLKLPDNINMVVLDELLSINFDEVRISGALDILNELAERDLSIFVIDHKNTLKENLECEIINIDKDAKGYSRVEYDEK